MNRVVGPVRQAVTHDERLADHRDVEPGMRSSTRGRRARAARTSGQRVRSASSTNGSTTSTAARCRRPAPRAYFARARRRGAPRGPTPRSAPSRAPTSPRRRATARAIGRACGAAAATPNRSAIVAYRSTFVVSASHVARRSTPGHATSSGMWPIGSYIGHARLAPDVRVVCHAVAEVVAVVGAHDHRGRRRTRPLRSSASSTRPNQWSIIVSLPP